MTYSSECECSSCQSWREAFEAGRLSAQESGTIYVVSLFRDYEMHRKLDVIIHELHHIKTTLNINTNKENHIMAILDELQASVEVDTNVTNSAVTLLQNLAAQLEAAGTDETKLAEIRDALNSNSQALADAVTANTPAADNSEPAPGSTPGTDPNTGQVLEPTPDTTTTGVEDAPQPGTPEDTDGEVAVDPAADQVV